MPPGFRPHLLVVDDDASLREALAAGLAERYVVHAAKSGAEACALLRAHPVAVIILDAMLGEEQGLDLVGRFRALSPAPVLVLTGYGSEDLAVRALRARVAEYLKKPVSLPELHAALGRVGVRIDNSADLAARARRHLDEHAAKPFRSTELAGRLGVSEAHLRRIFRQACGKTPRQYLAEARIRRAANLLRTTAHGVKQIALEVGYPDLKQFRRAFGRLIGTTPIAWRQAERPYRK